MFTYSDHLSYFFLILFPLNSYATIAFDGSLGPAETLSGPHYIIDAHQGMQRDHNLFHSFSEFGLDSGESATFMGPNSIMRIIGRVTGERVSVINGALNTAIPDADLYLFNPNGIVLGAQANLNLSGAFYLSSADYLKFADDQRFDAHQSGLPTLSIAEPTAFGFLNNQPRGITVADSFLTLPIEKNFSLIGGPIQIQNSVLLTPAGHLQVASVASTGEVKPTDITQNTITQGGKITLQDTFVDTTAQWGGAITIQGGRFLMRRTALQTQAEKYSGATTITATEVLQVTEGSRIQTLLDEGNGGAISLRSQQIDISQDSQFFNFILRGAGRGGNIELEATDSITITDSELSVGTVGSGNSGDLVLTTPQLQVENSVLVSSSESTGASGDVNIKAQQLTLRQGGRLGTDVRHQGKGGMVNLQVSEAVSIAGQDIDGRPSAIFSQTRGQGPAGAIMLETAHITLSEGATINADTVSAGRGGDITITADALDMQTGAAITSSSANAGQGGRMFLKVAQANLDASAIWAITTDQGDAGHIDLKAKRLTLTGGAQINVSSTGAGQGGNIVIQVADTAIITGEDRQEKKPSGIGSSAFSTGTSGTLQISAQTLKLDKRGTLQTLARGTGQAGDIMLTVDTLHISAGGDIDASNEGTSEARGGNITIHANGSVLIMAEKVADQFFGGVYSNAGQKGQGGHITLSADKLSLQQGGTVSAASQGTGHAGNIVITVQSDLHLKEASITTHAQQAGGGNIYIQTPFARLHMTDSQITARAEGLTIQDQGGNVIISNKDFLILNDSEILASAVGGDGGNIQLSSHHFLRSYQSRLDASSALGVDGTVAVNAPETDVVNSFMTLPAKFFDAATLLKPACTSRALMFPSRLTVTREVGFPTDPRDQQSSLPLPVKTEAR